MNDEAPALYCRDCKFIEVSGINYAAATCAHPKLAADRIDLVSGEMIQKAPYPCSYARGMATLCGHRGRYFVARVAVAKERRKG